MAKINKPRKAPKTGGRSGSCCSSDVCQGEWKFAPKAQKMAKVPATSAIAQGPKPEKSAQQQAKAGKSDAARGAKRRTARAAARRRGGR